MRTIKAFTLIELVYVIVIAGILSVVALSKISHDNLQEAAKSLLDDIRYLQILALSNNVYDGKGDYFNYYWHIYFHCVANTKTSYGKYKCNHKEVGYSIFSDKLGANTNNPDFIELADDYLNPEKKIGARFAGISVDETMLSKRANLTKSFDIARAEIFYKTGLKTRKTSRLFANELGELSVKDSKEDGGIFVIRLNKEKASKIDDFICIVVNQIGYSYIPKFTEKGQIVWYSGSRKIPKYCHKLASK